MAGSESGRKKLSYQRDKLYTEKEKNEQKTVLVCSLGAGTLDF